MMFTALVLFVNFLCGFLFWMTCVAIGWSTDTAAFVCGALGASVGVVLIGWLLKDDT